jgi:7-keto-8-aminopelargonate synthetase-like enzyme
MGTISALVRKKDAIFRDRFSHASIHDVCRSLDTRSKYIYPHQDMQKLEAQLQEYSSHDDAMGKLIITDGVFSMHGRLAPLPKLVELAKRYQATLMVDEAHSVGVIGDQGRGLEDHYNLPGSIDVLMGTFSKAPGTAGGYVCGSKELIGYLRFFANAAVFTASLPAANCAGVTEAFKIMAEEPQHREMLWKNIRTLAPALKSAGFIVSDPESPILTVFMGSNKLLWAFSRELFLAGVKCGNVSYPAVPHGEAILRLAVNARHTAEDISQCVDIMTQLGKRFAILHKSPEEIRELSEHISFAEAK